MRYTPEIKESAKNDITEAFLYYESKQEGLGEKFLQSLERRLEELMEEAGLYQKRYKDFRQVIIKPYPYHIIYEIEQDTIVIYKIAYGGRHPRKRYVKQ